MTSHPQPPTPQYCQRLEGIIHAARAGIVDLDLATGAASYSERAKEILGYPPQANTGSWPSFLELVHAEDRVPFVQDADPLCAQQDAFNREFRMQRADGTLVWISGAGVYDRDASGRAIRLTAMLRDISRRKAQEAQLRDRMKFTDDLLDLMPVEVTVRDAHGRYTLVNRAWEDSSGMDRIRVLGMTAAEIFPPRRAQSIDDSDRAALDLGGKTLYSDIQVRSRDTGYRYLAVSKTAMLDTGGEVIGVLATATDVTALRETELALKEQIKFTRDLIDANPIPIYLKDIDCRYIDINPAFVRHSGFTVEQTIGRTAFDLLPAERAAHYDTQDRELLARGEGTSAIEAEVPRSDGMHYYIMNKSILRRSDGTVRGLVCTITEVTALKRVEAELRASREEALQAAQAKAAFLATMSHEIRTPLNGVIGMTGILADTGLTPEQRDYVETIRMSGETLLSVINDILDFSKIESGKLDLEHEPVDIARVIEQAFEILGERARSKRLELLYDLDDDVPSHVYGDGAFLRQILVNLAGNAVKFTDSGEIFVGVKRRADSSDASNVLEFRVSDTGIGIPADRLHVLFRPFTQVDASTTRKYGGTGLGLAICKRLTELMGGTISVESEPGRGSTFVFTIKCESAPPPLDAESKAVFSDLSGKRVLIVDDNASNLRILEHQLKRWGVEARAASDGRTACDLIARGERFDGAIVDFQMPEMNGVMLAQAIKRQAAGARIPIILLSSSASRHMKGGALFAAQLLKPTRQSQLFDALVTALSGRRATARGAVSPAGVAPLLARRLPLRLLVVDDNDVNRRIAQLMLRKLGYQADTAADGRQALAAVGRAPYDMVFMDVQMPGMDGFEATREIGRSAAAKRPIIIAMTANAMEGDRDECLAAGMDDYLSKPLEAAAMQAVIERWGGRARPRQEGRALSVTPERQATLSSELPAVDWLRLHEIAQFDDASGSLIRKLIGSFVVEGKSRTDAIRRTASRRDARGLAAAAHALKGAALNLGARALAEVCGIIEGAARDGRTDGLTEAVLLQQQRYAEAVRLLQGHARRNTRPRRKAALTRKRSKGRPARRKR